MDGKLTGKVLVAREESNRKPPTVTQEGSTLRIQGPPEGIFTVDFRAPIVNPPPKRWLGGYALGKRMHAAWLTRVTEAEAEQIARGFGTGKEAATHVCPPLQEAGEIISKLDGQIGRPRFGIVGQSAAAMYRAYDKRIAAFDEIAKKETAPHYRKAVAKFPNDPAVFVAVLGLLRSANTNKATLDEVKSWSAAADKPAKEYGPHFEVGFAANAVEALEGQDAYATVAVDYARRVERALPAKASLQEQIDALRPVAKALRSAGKADDGKTLEGRIAELEVGLDREYLAALPEVKPFAARKSKSDRVVLLEQFTPGGFGSKHIEQACSLLSKAYKPGELVVVQYGSGPLSSPDGSARWGYYRRAFPLEVGSTSSLFNGFPKGRLAGRADYEGTLKTLREFIDPLLEEDAGAKIAAKAVRTGDKIDIEVNVTLKQADEDKKLRIVLVEREIRYRMSDSYGSTGPRLHHNIARAFPGGVAGKPLAEAVSKHVVTVDVGELRKQLAKHLEDAFDESGRLLAVPPPAVSSSSQVCASSLSCRTTTRAKSSRRCRWR